MGAGFDIVSGGELFRAIKAEAQSDKIVYSGVGKTTEEIKQALDRVVSVTKEIATEMKRANDLKEKDPKNLKEI